MSDQPTITSDADLDTAIAEIDALLMLDRDADQESRLDSLADAVEAYEDIHHPIHPPSDAERIAYLKDLQEAVARHVAENRAQNDEPRSCRTIVLKRLPPPDDAMWRAYLAGAEHCGGCGLTPEKAIGWMVLNNPQRCGIGKFEWHDTPPELPHPEVSHYPFGEQEEFDHLP